jgi:hypothetical protein
MTGQGVHRVEPRPHPAWPFGMRDESAVCCRQRPLSRTSDDPVGPL